MHCRAHWDCYASHHWVLRGKHRLKTMCKTEAALRLRDFILNFFFLFFLSSYFYAWLGIKNKVFPHIQHLCDRSYYYIFMRCLRFKCITKRTAVLYNAVLYILNNLYVILWAAVNEMHLISPVISFPLFLIEFCLRASGDWLEMVVMQSKNDEILKLWFRYMVEKYNASK